MKRFALIALLMAPATSFAIPVQWTLDGYLITSRGVPAGTAGGSFIYDADTGAFSDIALFTTGSPSGGLTFSAFAGEAEFFALNFVQAGVAEVQSTIAFQLNGIYRSLLTNAGGVLTVNPNPGIGFFAEFQCGGITDCGLGNGAAVSNWFAWGPTPSTLTGRQLSVDEPGTLGLMGAAAFLALITRRRRAANQKTGG